MIIKVFRKTIDLNGDMLISDKMEVDRDLISKWLLNRINIPHFKDRMSMIKFITGLSVLTEPVSSNLFGPIEFFYNEHKDVINTFNLSVVLLDDTNLDIVVDKFNSWDDNFPETNRKLKDILQEEKQEKLNFDSYSHYIPTEVDGLFVYEDIYVDNFITFLSLNFLSLNKKTSLDWYNSKNEKVDYEGGNEEFWVFHLTT